MIERTRAYPRLAQPAEFPLKHPAGRGYGIHQSVMDIITVNLLML